MTKGKGIILGFLVLFSALFLTGIASAEQWANTYEKVGSSNSANSIQQTSDGGYIVAGLTDSFGITADAWVLKLDSRGNITWQKTYDRNSYDSANSIQQTSDGGYIVAGYTSFGADYDADVWVLKLDSSGNVTWQKTYGGADPDYANSIRQTSDGGYIVAGGTNSFGAGYTDAWVLKLDSSGNVTWQKTYGGADWDCANSIRQTSDGGYIVAGWTAGYDSWVLKLDSSGNVTWQKTYDGGADWDYANSIRQTSDGGYIVAGWTYSFGAGNSDAWVLKLDSSGNVTWQKTYGGAGGEFANSIQQTSDGGYIVAGYTFTSFGADYDADVWVLKLDSSGNVTWQKTYGGVHYDYANFIQQTSDGGYIVAGETSSFGADYHADFLVLKLDSSGSIPGCPLMGTYSAAVNDTSVSVIDTSVTPYTSSAIVNTTTITPADSTASLTQVCPIPTSALTVAKSGTGRGTVTSSPAGINCGTDCSEVYTFGTNVTLTATFNVRSTTFGGWSGDCSSCGTNTTCSIIMDADKSCTATFNQRKRMRHWKGLSESRSVIPK
ncbi:MAG: hypothetical protein HY752_06310 [Nitrospirae bacterium]|nr:hypothetical protein [Nitrospirota bacterium]